MKKAPLGAELGEPSEGIRVGFYAQSVEID